MEGAKVLDATVRDEPGQENSILTDARLPLGDALAGQFVIVRYSDPVRNFKGMASKEREEDFWYRRDWVFDDLNVLHRALEIDHIRREGEHCRIILRDYTNVVYDKSGGFWEFQFKPHYAFRKAELLFKNQASTVPMLKYTPRKIYDPADENNFLSVPQDRLVINVTTRPSGAPVVSAFGGSDPDADSPRVKDGKLTLTHSGVLRLQALNPEGVMKPRSIASHYLIGNLPAKTVPKDQLKPGIELVTRGAKPTTRLLEQVDFSTYGQPAAPGAQPAVIRGYIEVPKSGVTEFGLFTDSSSRVQDNVDEALYVDGEKVIDTLQILGLARLRANIALEKGLHSLRIDVHTNEARLYWKLPGSKAMVPVPKAAFFHQAH